MLHWQTFARLPNSELAKLDIAQINLACAVGLPTTDNIDFGFTREQLDNWAAHTRRFTERSLSLFYSGRSDYSDSEARFRIQAMITFLQRDVGIRFRTDKRSNDAILTPSDTFLHGILRGEGGTCGSLPIL